MEQRSAFSIKKEVVEKQKNVCNICQNSFAWPSLLKEHQKFVHNPSEENICDICSDEFQSPGKLKEHILSEHKGRPNKNLRCGLCEKTFKKSQYFYRHIKIIHKSKTIFQCYICNKSFATESMLKIHIEAVHHGEKKKM